MKYLAKSFTVPAVEKSPEHCTHGWEDKKRRRCVLCGASMRYEDWPLGLIDVLGPTSCTADDEPMAELLYGPTR